MVVVLERDPKQRTLTNRQRVKTERRKKAQVDNISLNNKSIVREEEKV